MAIIIIKILKRISSFFKKIVLKLIYLNRISFGKNAILYKNFSIIIEKNGFVKIGNNNFFNRNCSINCMKSVIIGDNCIFGENVCIYDHNHNFKKSNIPIKKQGYNSSEITIGDNCWIGSNVIILKGVKIGSNCVIGAGTIVNKNVPDNMIVYNKTELVMKVIKDEQ